MGLREAVGAVSSPPPCSGAYLSGRREQRRARRLQLDYVMLRGESRSTGVVQRPHSSSTAPAASTATAGTLRTTRRCHILSGDRRSRQQAAGPTVERRALVGPFSQSEPAGSRAPMIQGVAIQSEAAGLISQQLTCRAARCLGALPTRAPDGRAGGRRKGGGWWRRRARRRWERERRSGSGGVVEWWSPAHRAVVRPTFLVSGPDRARLALTPPSICRQGGGRASCLADVGGVLAWSWRWLAGWLTWLRC